jgi:hypothetical protein
MIGLLEDVTQSFLNCQEEAGKFEFDEWFENSYQFTLKGIDRTLVLSCRPFTPKEILKILSLCKRYEKTKFSSYPRPSIQLFFKIHCRKNLSTLRLAYMRTHIIAPLAKRLKFLKPYLLQKREFIV